jgi:hypothetical protein
VRSVGVKQFFVSVSGLFVFVKGEGVFELLGEVLVDGLSALQDGSSVFEALDLLHDEADGIDFILFAAVDRDDALAVLFLLVGEDFDHGPSRPLDDVSDHIAL